MKKFPHYRQLDAMDCGPTCLRIIAKSYGRNYSLQFLREKSYITREGVSLLGISDAAEAIGFKTLSAKLTIDELKKEIPFPLIAHWRQQHFVVVYGYRKGKFLVSDPAIGLIKFSEEEFKDGWLSDKIENNEVGIVLMLETTPDFYEVEDDKSDRTRLSFLFKYITPHKRYIVQLILGMFVGSTLQLIFPFLTQSIVDIGIQNENIDFITLILIGQIFLFISRNGVEFIRGWILLHLGTRINISLISDFLIKLMKLPMGFFDVKMIGDLLQRIGDHRRIEAFLTSTTLTSLFSLLNLLVFGVVLLIYDLKIFSIFFTGSILYVIWVILFMKKRRELDYKRFDQMAMNQNSLIQLIHGMQEIKLQNCERQKRWGWERIQAKLFKVSIKSLLLNQYQVAGASFINELKNILITFAAANAVINGQITLGMMLAIQYIIGQLNAPIDQLVGFIHSTQDAKISLERLGEIHNRKDEEYDDGSITIVPTSKTIVVENLDFRYEGPHSEKVLEGINLTIREGEVTAIVGASGSGKTTLIKLLLRFYNPVGGEIKVGGLGITNIKNRVWRNLCGAVLQDGYIFSDSIANNIAVSDEIISKERLLYAVNMANIKEFIESLPLGYNTQIGSDGHGLSQGQKQRILIARAIYKNPEYLFFDEATNSLDSSNEKIILKNLEEFFKGKTAIIVAHRLSTVKSADKIIVLDKGRIIEEGTHSQLVREKGSYYQLVKNQLELGN